MRIKRMVLLASMALAAVAFAAPATASADATWTHDGVPITAEKKFSLHDNLTFTALGNTSTCTFTAHIAILPGGGGSAFLTEVANGTGGVCHTTFPNCTLHRVSNTSPWPITATKPNKIDITGISLTLHFVGDSCANKTITMVGNLTGTVDKAEEISTVSFDTGSGTLKIANMFNVHVEGTLTSSAPKTYGIE